MFYSTKGLIFLATDDSAKWKLREVGPIPALDMPEARRPMASMCFSRGAPLVGARDKSEPRPTPTPLHTDFVMTRFPCVG